MTRLRLQPPQTVRVRIDHIISRRADHAALVELHRIGAHRSRRVWIADAELLTPGMSVRGRLIPIPHSDALTRDMWIMTDIRNPRQATHHSPQPAHSGPKA